MKGKTRVVASTLHYMQNVLGGKFVRPNTNGDDNDDVVLIKCEAHNKVGHAFRDAVKRYGAACNSC